MPNLNDHVSCHVVVMYISHLNFVLIMHSEVCWPRESWHMAGSLVFFLCLMHWLVVVMLDSKSVIFFIAITCFYLSIVTLISFLSAHTDCEDLFW